MRRLGLIAKGIFRLERNSFFGQPRTQPHRLHVVRASDMPQDELALDLHNKVCLDWAKEIQPELINGYFRAMLFVPGATGGPGHLLSAHDGFR